MATYTPSDGVYLKSYRQSHDINKLYSADLSGGGTQTKYKKTTGAISNTVPEIDAVLDMQAKGIYDRQAMGWHKSFSRIGIIDPYQSHLNSTEYVFFVKPDLHLFNAASASHPNPELTGRSAYFNDVLTRYPHVGAQLQYSTSMSEAGGPLSPLLSNALKGTLELPNISADTIETPQNAFGTKIDYRGTSYKSDEGYDFNLEFTDTKYLEVYHYFKMYDEYERMKSRGMVTPTKPQYITYKNLHDQGAIYKFIVGDDGMSILYYARIVGVFPTSVPRDTFSKLDNGELSYSVSFHGQFVRDSDPMILQDFNDIVSSYRGSSVLPLWDAENHHFDPTWAKCPYVYIRGGSTSSTLDQLNQYYLMWTI